MATTWHETAIQRSEAITHAWQVALAYAGRVAEWILFICMIGNIIETITPLPELLVNWVLGVQVVMLDVGGFSLQAMAHQAKKDGNTDAANSATITGWALIAIMMVTVLCVGVGQEWHTMKQITWWTDLIEKILIIVRIAMVVVYGHVVHNLRQHRQDIQPVQNTSSTPVQYVQPAAAPVHIEEIDKLTEEVNRLSALMVQMTQTVNVYIDSQGMDKNIQQYGQHRQATYTPVHETYTPIETPVQLAIDAPVAVTISPIEDVQAVDEQATTATPQAQITTYPQVVGIAADVVKLVVDEHLTGTAWTAVAAKVGKNYSRVIKPIRDAYTQTCTPAQQK